MQEKKKYKLPNGERTHHSNYRCKRWKNMYEMFQTSIVVFNFSTLYNIVYDTIQ